MKHATIASIGHSNKSLETFIATLKKHRIEIVADVRSIPASRFSPHFSKKPLGSELAKRDIQYLYRGQNLGGRGVNVGWDDAIEELVALAKKGTRVCVMCAEADYRKCHRYTTITPTLEEKGLRVVHIEYENEATKRHT
ncbi:DUF488 domain-containing protein [Candidatus Kaiserbacteria bacterium]|nr:DUF488 domain-containing protein [Candidatus Kaiserbacteria bacterium]